MHLKIQTVAVYFNVFLITIASAFPSICCQFSLSPTSVNVLVTDDKDDGSREVGCKIDVQDSHIQIKCSCTQQEAS